MKTSDFYYELPDRLIAQTPIEPRDHSRLLVMGRTSGKVEHDQFYQIKKHLKPGDLLVVNNSKVIPARLYGVRPGTTGKCEVLLLKELKKSTWECLVKPGKKLRTGANIEFGGGTLTGEIVEVLKDGNRIIEFQHEGESIYPILERIGEMPLPHYITEELGDKERYQTVYAKTDGSAAAPTAGLHFTEKLMVDLVDYGVNIAHVTLHVGLGTFRPVKADIITDHHMHFEHYTLPGETAALINQAKEQGGRVIAVGTTSCRTLESAALKHWPLKQTEDDTDIFIYPGFEFRVLDGLITNFHLPESTLIMLVSAFCGHENTMNAYKLAVEKEYRFFSFGDAMLII